MCYSYKICKQGVKETVLLIFVAVIMDELIKAIPNLDHVKTKQLILNVKFM